MSGENSGWANPMPAGLTALGIAVFIFYGMFTGKVSHEAYPIAAIWLIAGFFVQVIVGIIELKMGSVVGGNTFTWFSSYFMMATGGVWLFEYYAGIYGWPFDPRIAGFTWLAITIVLLLEIPSFAKTMPALTFLLIIIMDCSLPIITGLNLGLLNPAVWAPVAGNMAGISGLLGLYSAAAVTNNMTFGRPILPFPGPIIQENTQKTVSMS